MKNNSVKSGMIKILSGLVVLTLVGCAGYHTIIKNQEVNNIPEDKYERIIKLDNPEGVPYNTLAGVVFIKKGAKVCTNYPREEDIESLAKLGVMEKQAYPFFSTYAIKVGEEIFGFIAIPVDYRVLIWEDKKNDECRFMVDIIQPESKGRSFPSIDGGILPGAP
jgi:hypothetical protein